MTRWMRLTGVLALACVPAGCGGGGGEWRGSVRDSAGVAIVTNPATGIWTAQTTPTIQEELRVGSAEGPVETQFGQIAALDVDAQGRIYVLDTQARRVRVFDGNGAFLREMGGSGAGPGELGLGASALLLTPGDTVVVVDLQNQRMNRYAPDGSAVAAFPLSFNDGIPIRFLSLPDRRIVQQARPMGPAAAADPRDRLLVRGHDGVVQDTLLVLPAGQSFSLTGGEMRIKLFDPEPIWSLDDAGRTYFGMNAEYRIEVRGTDGRLERIITKPFERQPVAQSDRDEFLRALREAWAQVGMPPAAMDQMLAAIDFADSYPAYAQFIAGPGGTLWVQHLRTARMLAEAGGEFNMQDIGAPRWDVFDGEGRLLGTLDLPDHFAPLRIVGDRIYGIWRDDLDVQHIMRLRVVGLRAEP